MTTIKFYSAWFCPFAQRVWIALLHKRVDFQLIDIDPYDKFVVSNYRRSIIDCSLYRSEQWLSINPRGLVPALIDADGRLVNESTIIIEYLDACLSDSIDTRIRLVIVDSIVYLFQMHMIEHSNECTSTTL